MPFMTMGLPEPLVRGIQANGYTTPTEIQSQAIPAALCGQDIIGCAKTGTGKTLVFVLPILNRLLQSRSGKKPVIRALILTPTRELAVQIERSIHTYGRFTNVRTLAVYGGVSMNQQLDTLRRGIDVVVATPGRLMDHMRRHTIDLRSVDVLVLDEADRMFDMGFIADVQKIVAAVPTQRQTMLFSATISLEVQRLAAGIQQSPVVIEIGEQNNPIDTITQYVHAVGKDKKLDLLVHMLQNKPMYSVLVFSRTKHGADKIHHKLERAGINSMAIHSGRSQSQRQRALDGFRSGKFQVLVATDIAARGIDVRGISHVVNFDVPAYAEDYIHRIGRTGRATATGDAITLVSPDERDQLSRIERFIGSKIKLQEYEGFTDSHFTAVLSQSPERTKAQRQVLRARKASKRPRFNRGRRAAGMHAGR
jgi:ATP-dependent RNA helicase RhlE